MSVYVDVVAWTDKRESYSTDFVLISSKLVLKARRDAEKVVLIHYFNNEF